MAQIEKSITQEITWEPVIRHQVAIAGRVINAKTQVAIAGAQVTLVEMPKRLRTILQLKALQYGNAWEQMPQRPDRSYSDKDGHYFFRDLPEGDYKIEAFLPNTGTRYGSVSQAVILSADPAHRRGHHVDLFLPTTGLQGKITAPEDEKFMAKVQIQGQNDYALTNGDGKYLLTGVEAGQKQVVLMISASGYELDLPEIQNPPKILLVQGAVLTEQNFRLKRKSMTNGISSSANRSPP
jgi:hypothetical protein